jgi:hypothetical protein
MAYVRTGSDLKLPSDMMQQIFNQYNLFKAKNFTEVLDKIVAEIGEKIVDPYQVWLYLIKLEKNSFSLLL